MQKSFINGEYSDKLFTRLQKIIFLGNPGKGKSTLLNALAGRIAFQSSESPDGVGVTREFSDVEVQRDIGDQTSHWKLVDTPGLADPVLKQEASRQISKLLRSKRGEDGELIPHRIVFVMALVNGRLVDEDMATMRVILNAAREIKSYGIIVNDVRDLAARQQDPENKRALTKMEAILTDLKDEKNNAAGQVHWFPKIETASGKTNFQISGPLISDLWDFVLKLPAVQVKHVDQLEIDDLKRKIEEETLRREKLEKNAQDLQEAIQQLLERQREAEKQQKLEKQKADSIEQELRQRLQQAEDKLQQQQQNRWFNWFN